MKAWASILLLFVLVSLVGIAQEDAPADCDYGAMGERLVEVGEGLAESDDPATALRELQAELSGFNVLCTGLSFSSADYGLQPAIGPFTIPAGVYRLTLVTDARLYTDYTALSGCDSFEFLTAQFSASRGEASEGIQTALELERDCEVLLVVNGAEDEWTIEFEKLR